MPSLGMGTLDVRALIEEKCPAETAGDRAVAIGPQGERYRPRIGRDFASYEMPGAAHHEDRRTVSCGGRSPSRPMIDPTALGICHCTDCQMLSGSAFRTTFSAGRFRAPDRCAEELRQEAESGSKRRHAFCGTCGTPILPARQSPPELFAAG